MGSYRIFAVPVILISSRFIPDGNHFDNNKTILAILIYWITIRSSRKEKYTVANLWNIIEKEMVYAYEYYFNIIIDQLVIYFEEPNS